MRRCTRRYSSRREEFYLKRSGSGRAVSRILSAFLRTERIICLSSQYPKPVHFRGRGTSRSSVSYLALHPMGFSVPRCLRSARCALTAPFHPYPGLAPVAVCSLWHCPLGRLAPSPPACIAGLTGVTRHRALWCSDFPPSTHVESDPPPSQNR